MNITYSILGVEPVSLVEAKGNTLSDAKAGQSRLTKQIVDFSVEQSGAKNDLTEVS